MVLTDTLFLDIKKGLNELFIISKDDLGGWSFIFSFDNGSITKVPENLNVIKQQSQTPAGKLYPESAVYHPEEDVIYYTNFDGTPGNPEISNGFVSKVNNNGEILEMKFIDKLDKPTGICLYDNKLYVVERSAIAEISIDERK